MLSTTVYRKRTHTDKYLHFDSHHPLSHKLAVARTLFSRADTHCTFALDRTQEQLHVTQSLALNGYPHQVISRYCDRRRPTQGPEQDPPAACATIPYVRNVSVAIRRVLTPLNIRTSFKPQTTLRNLLVHAKDPTPQESQAGIVYQICCSDCPATYIGQIGRTLQHQLKEHKYALTSGHVWNSAVAEHAANTGHAIKWDGAEVIHSHPHLKQRCVLEAWHIQKQAHTINREHGQLPRAYHHLTRATNMVTCT